MNGFPEVSKIKTFYINLETDTSRRQKFINDDILNYQRFPAVSGKNNKDNEEFMKKISLMSQVRIYFNAETVRGEIENIGAIGCSLSHYYLWKSFYDGTIDKDYLSFLTTNSDKNYANTVSFSKSNSVEDDYLIVMEDDVDIFDKSKLRTIQNELNKLITYDWDIWLVTYGGTDTENLLQENFSNVHNGIFKRNRNCNTTNCKINAFGGTMFYIIKRSTIKKIIEYENFFPIECHIDVYLSLLSQKKILKIIGLLDERSIVNFTTGEKSTIEHNYYFSREKIVISYSLNILFVIIIIALAVVIILNKKLF